MAAETLDLPVEGMTCSACVARLEAALVRVPGVVDARVNLALERATVALDDRSADAATLTDAVARAGFVARTEQRTFAVAGMTCSACSARVEKALLREPGVVDAKVNPALERAAVTALPGCAPTAALAERVARAGYRLTAEPRGGGADQQAAQDRQRLESEQRLVVISAVLTAPLVASMLLAVLGYEDLHLMPAAEVLLVTPIQFVIGARFYRAAFNALRAGGANMDVLVAMGTTAAYVYSWYLLTVLGEAANGQLYFEASAVIITLVLLGKHLESRAKRATTSAIRQLMDLKPATARVRRAAGEVREEGEVRKRGRGRQMCRSGRSSPAISS